jgi:hypothetical protein
VTAATEQVFTDAHWWSASGGDLLAVSVTDLIVEGREGVEGFIRSMAVSIVS